MPGFAVGPMLGASAPATGGGGGFLSSVLSGAGAGAPGGPVAAGIGAGAGVAQALIGKGAGNRASAAAAKGQMRAEKLQSGDRLAETVTNDYAMQREQAERNRRMQMHNALLRSYGATGLQDPTVNMDALNAPPPDLTGIIHGKGNLGGLGPQQAAPRPPGPGSLGAFFGR